MPRLAGIFKKEILPNFVESRLLSQDRLAIFVPMQPKLVPHRG